MPRRLGSHRQLKCTVCLSAERGRFDFLACTGAALKPLAAKFHFSYDSARNHVAKHISTEYKNAVRNSPLQNEEQLRKLASEAGVSVIENLRAVYGGLANRWLHAFEAGDDHRLSLLTSKLHANLEMQARITKELAPAGSTFNTVNNNFLLTDAAQLLRILQPFPEARAAVVAYYAERSAPKVIEHDASATD